MSTIRSHRDLEAWQEAMNLVMMAYELATRFPATERYGLTSQMQRAAVSVPANIAEGRGRGTRLDYAHHVTIARGSLYEVETYVLIATRLGYVADADATPILSQIASVGRLVNKLRRGLLDNE